MRIGILRGLSVGLVVGAVTGLLTIQVATAAPIIAASATTVPATPSALAAVRAGAAPRADAAPRAGASGPLLTWGSNQDGELGDGSMADEHSPVAVNPPADLRVTSARVTTFGIGVTATGQVRTWGRGLQGELGNGAKSSRLRPVLVKLPKGVKVREARPGLEFAVAVTTGGRVLAWGEGSSGELGNGHRTSSDVPVWVDLPRGVLVTAVSAGASSVIALTSTGRVLAWGENTVGELGDGRRASTDRPVWVNLPSTDTITAVGAGAGHMFAVTSAGALLAWGDNAFGDLGIGARGIRRSPVLVHLPARIKVVAAFGGVGHSLALTQSGKVFAWGYDGSGQLGDG